MNTEDSLTERSIEISEGLITAFALSVSVVEHIWITSSTGIISCWDWTTGKHIETRKQIDGRVQSLAVFRDAMTSCDALVMLVETSGQWHILIDDHLLYKSLVAIDSLVLEGTIILATAYGKLIVGKPKFSVQGGSAYDVLEYRTAANITCVAAQSQATTTSQKKGKKLQNTLTVALGSTTGEIYVYDDVSKGSDPALPDPRLLHWHRDAVETLAWSKDANYLISGGRETVLVLWQIATGKKQFLPHLAAEIENITVAPSGTAYAVQLADNSVMVLSTSELVPIANFAGFQAQLPSYNNLTVDEVKSFTNQVDALSLARRTLAAPAVISPLYNDEVLVATSASVLRGSSAVKPRAFLQTFDSAHNRHVTRQALTRNKLTDFDTGPEGNVIQEPDVSLLQVSHDGTWLATAEEWIPPMADAEHLAADTKTNDEHRGNRREIYLKFWQWNEQKKVWVLDTRIDNPHPCDIDGRPGGIQGLVSDPILTAFATLGEDNHVRIWKPKIRRRGDKDEVIVEDWTCGRSIGLTQGSGAEQILEHDKGARPGDYSKAGLAYSNDGSLIAVSYPGTGPAAAQPLHFISTDTGSISYSRSGLFTGAVSAIGFLGRHLVVLTTTSIHVWDIVSWSSAYRIDLGKPDPSIPLYSRTRHLAISTADSSFCVAIPSQTNGNTVATKVQIYSLETTRPTFSADMPGVVTSVLANPGSSSSSSSSSSKGFTILNGDAEILKLSPTKRAHVFSSNTNTKPQALTTTTSIASTETMQLLADTITNTDERPEEIEEEDSDREIDAHLEQADRPVVRPEQLARIFDVAARGGDGGGGGTPGVVAASSSGSAAAGAGASFGGGGGGTLPVRAMFEAVAGLFARKPVGGSKGLAGAGLSATAAAAAVAVV